MCGSPSRSRDVMFRETMTTKWCLLALFVVSCFARGPPAPPPPPLASSVLAGDQNDVQDYLRPRIVAVASEGEEEETAHSEGPYEGDLPFVTLLGETARGVIPGPLWALRTDEGAEGERRGEIPPPPPPLLKEPYAGTWRKPVLPLYGYYLPDQNLVSDPCKSDVQYFYTSLSNGDFWPYQMMDSWGKMPDGYIDGNMLVMGAFDECLYVKVSKESHSFEGQYCMILLSNITATNETEELGTEGKGLLRVASSLRPTQFFPMYSTCLPSTCNETDLQDSLKEVVHSQGLDVPAVFCQTSAPPSLAYNARDIVMIIVLVLLVLMAAMATVVDIFIAITNQQRIAKGPLRYLLVFSLYTNLPKMFRINTNQNKEVISCLLGMRVLSMTWVVWGHQYLISFFTTANKLSGMKKYLTGNLLNQIILNAMPSVDTFFFMSGLLVAYGLTKEFERTRRFNPVIFYIHRFLRLSVPIMLVAGFMAVFPPLLVRGPLAPFTTAPKNIADYCSRYWWRDAFFVSNFFTEGGNFEMCLAVCWYTSVDFQLFLVTPVVLLPLLHRPRPGAAWMGFVTLMSFLIPAVVIGVNHLPPMQGLSADQDKGVDYITKVYMKPWCRASPYIIGMWLGYFLWSAREKTIILKKWQVSLGWMAAVGVALAVVLGIRNYNELFVPIHPYDAADSILYGSLHRGAWALALLWVVFACHNGYGGPVDGFLSHPSWQPISRLTYPIFLIAIPVQSMLYFYSIHLPLYFSHLNKILETVAVLFISGMGAVGLSLLTEAPVLGLEKLLLRKS